MTVNLGAPVVSRAFVFRDLAVRAWGAEWAAPDHGSYEFSNGRKFDSTDQSKSGVYDGSGTNYVMVGNGRYPDMPSNIFLLDELGNRIEQE